MEKDSSAEILADDSEESIAALFCVAEVDSVVKPEGAGRSADPLPASEPISFSPDRKSSRASLLPSQELHQSTLMSGINKGLGDLSQGSHNEEE